MILSLDNITYFYKNSVNIYQNQSLSLSTGLYFFKGKNGVGKSTLFKIINQELPLSEGNILFDDVILNKDNVFNYVSFMRQVPVFLERLTVKEHLLSLCNNEDKIKDILNKLDLNKVINQKIKSLSLGEKQRLSFASIYVLDRPIILLDEPFAHVNDELQQLMIDVINELKENKIIIIISHDELNMDFNKIITYKDHKLQTETLKENNDITYQFKDLDKFNFKYVFKRYFYNYLLKFILVFLALGTFFTINITMKNDNQLSYYQGFVTNDIHLNNTLLSSLEFEDCKTKHQNSSYIINTLLFDAYNLLESDYEYPDYEYINDYDYIINYHNTIPLKIGTYPSNSSEILIGINMEHYTSDIIASFINNYLYDNINEYKYKIVGIYEIKEEKTIEISPFDLQTFILKYLKGLDRKTITINDVNIRFNNELTQPNILLEEVPNINIKTPFETKTLTFPSYTSNEILSSYPISMPTSSLITMINQITDYNLCFYENESDLKKDFIFGTDLNFNNVKYTKTYEYKYFDLKILIMIFLFNNIIVIVILWLDNLLNINLNKKLSTLYNYNLKEQYYTSWQNKNNKFSLLSSIILYTVTYYSIFSFFTNIFWLIFMHLLSLIIVLFYINVLRKNEVIYDFITK